MNEQQQQKPMGLSEKQIAWCDQHLRSFETMRKQAELAASQLDQRPAIPKIELAN